MGDAPPAPEDAPEDVLEQYRLQGSPIPELFYWPGYLSEDEQERLQAEIGASRAPWKHVHGRRVQSLGGQVMGGALVAAPLPGWARALVSRLARDVRGFFGPGQQANHVLLNGYPQGQGILPHQDGPLYHAGVCILSLGSPAVMHFRRKQQSGPGRREEEEAPDARPGAWEGAAVALLPGSLLLFRGPAYTDSLHGIGEVDEDELAGVLNAGAVPQGLRTPGGRLPRTGERLSLTVRRVLRVRSLLR